MIIKFLRVSASLSLAILLSCAYLYSLPHFAFPANLSDHTAKIINMYYDPNHNTFGIPEIAGIKINLAIFIFILIAVLGERFLKILFAKNNGGHNITPGQWGLTAACYTVIFLITLQTISQTGSIRAEKIIFHGMTLEQKRDFIFALDSYQYTKIVKESLHGRHKALLITDSNKELLIDYYLIKYFLYPNIQMVDSNQSADTLLIFNKDDPVSEVPENFQIIGKRNSRNIIAIKTNE